MAFTKDTFRFLKDLEANNSKAWFDANRQRYEEHWKAPALDFIAAISQEMARLSPPLRAEPRVNGSLRRINRDVRFSADKSPYTPRLHMVFWSGEHPNRSPGVHVVLNAQRVGYGAGMWGIEPAKLAEYRQRICGRDGDRLIAALDEAGEVGCDMGAPDLVRLPKGFDADGRIAELLRYKSFVARTHDGGAPADVLIGEGAKAWVLQTTHSLLPLIRWLTE